MRVPLLLLLTALGLVLAPADALAAAGGGSSSFGGGGGGGGGGSSGGGFSGGSGGTGNLSGGEAVFIGVIVLIVVVWLVLSWIYRQAVAAFVRERLRRRRAKRVPAVQLAAAEAAEDDPAFAADAVRAGAAQLFHNVQAAWDADDRTRLKELVGKDLMVEWRRRLADFWRKGWHNHVEVLGDVKVEYVGLVNRAADEEDRAVVFIDAKLRDYVVDRKGSRINRKGESDDTVRLREYWTLGKREDGGWMVLSVEQDKEGAHHLESEIVASPWGDGRLRDEALVEGAVADRALEGYAISELADLSFDGDARAAALDLSLADGRFAPDVLEAAARAAVAAWAEAVDGDDGALFAVASPGVVRTLLHPDGATRRRLVVRGPQITSLSIAALDAAAEPPTMTVEVAVRGRRYVQDRDTAAVLSGSDSREVEFVERWVMSLSGDDGTPWRIAAAAAATARS